MYAASVLPYHSLPFPFRILSSSIIRASAASGISGREDKVPLASRGNSACCKIGPLSYLDSSHYKPSGKREWKCSEALQYLLYDNFSHQSMMCNRRRSSGMHLLWPLSIFLISTFTPQTSADLTLSITASPSQALSAVSSSAVTALLSTTSAVAPAAPKVVNGDPCGPAVQSNPNYPNTCNLRPTYGQSPSFYGVNCTETYDVQKYPATGVQWSTCAQSLISICTKMEDPRTITGKWIYSMLATGCALGFFLPPYQGSAPRPSTARCQAIFSAMVDSCTQQTSNSASINLWALPGFDETYFQPGGNGQQWPSHDINATGAAVNVGYPSYIIGTSVSGA